MKSESIKNKINFDKFFDFFLDNITTIGIVIGFSVFTVWITPKIFNYSIDFLSKNLAIEDNEPEELYYNNDITPQSICSNLDILSRNDIILFINKYFLDIIFNFDNFQVDNHYEFIVSNEFFFNFIKKLLSDNRFLALSQKMLTNSHDFKEYMIFVLEIRGCENMDDFNCIYKNKKIINHVILSIKDIYKL